MPKRSILEQESIRLSAVDFSTWPTVLLDNLSEKSIEIFLNRKRAVELYLTGEKTLHAIMNETGISRQVLYPLLHRCFEQDDQGVVWGFRALIPYKRIKTYSPSPWTRGKQASTAPGAFILLLEAYPSLKDTIDGLFLRTNKHHVNEPVITLKYLHRRFISACRDLGLTMSDYPLNTKNLGRKALERYIKRLGWSHFTTAAKRYGEEAARRASSTHFSNPPMIVRPFQRVQFDGHRIDALFSVTFHTPEGDEITRVIDRIWLLVIIDVATRYVVGHHLSLNREYSAADVLMCIRNAVVPRSPRKFNIPGLKYPPEYASTIPEIEWAVWDEFCYDNGKANLSQSVINRLTQVVDCAVNPGPIKSPEHRGIIERFFGIMEENGYHRLPSTTGSHPKDPKRQNPENNAIKYRISFEHVQDITEILVANHNTAPHSATNNLSPLEAVQQRIARGMAIRQLSPIKRGEVTFLSYQAKRTIKGNTSTGVRPYIQFEGVRYTNDVLSKSPALIGIDLAIFVNIEDIRTIRAYLPDGSELGLLSAVGKWGITPHTLQVRKEINKLRDRKHIHFTFRDDPIEVWARYVQSESVKSRRHRSQLLQINDILSRADNEHDGERHEDSREIPKAEVPKSTEATSKKPPKEPADLPAILRRTITY